MCVTLERNFITARTHPKMMLIQPKVQSNIMTLSAPDMPDINLDIKALAKEPDAETLVWGKGVEGVDCGDEIAHWLSKYLMGSETGVRLIYYLKDNYQMDLRKDNIVDKKDYVSTLVITYLFIASYTKY